MEIKNNDAMKMSYENRYKVFSIESRAKYIDKLYEPYKVRGLQETVLKNSPKYQYSDDRKDGYIISQGIDEKGYYAIFLPTENEYEKIKVFAEIKDKLVKLSELANLQRQLTERNKTYTELNLIEKKIDELYIDIFKNKTDDIVNQSNEKETKNYLKHHWFVVGLSFANGTIQKLYDDLKSGTKIAIHLGNKNYRPYITETKGNSTDSDKNIYRSYEKMKIIFEYCIEKNIEICDEFKSIYNNIKPH